MKVVVVGGTGLVGSQVVALLRDRGHEVVPASPASGVDTLTGAGLAEALAGAEVVVDVTGPPTYEPDAVMEFFRTSTTNLAQAEVAAGVGHHVALSIVGAERLPDSGYLRAKVAQEELVQASPVPHTVVRATQFYEFLRTVADTATDHDVVRATAEPLQPMASADVATAVARAAEGAPLHGTTEIGGPEALPLAELLRRRLAADGDTRTVVADPTARYFGALVGPTSLLPGPDAWLGPVTLDRWLSSSVAVAR